MDASRIPTAQGSLTLIANVRQFALGAALQSCLRLREYTTNHLSRLPLSKLSSNAPSKRALLAMGGAAYVVSFCITLLLLA